MGIVEGLKAEQLKQNDNAAKAVAYDNIMALHNANLAKQREANVAQQGFEYGLKHGLAGHQTLASMFPNSAPVYNPNYNYPPSGGWPELNIPKGLTPEGTAAYIDRLRASEDPDYYNNPK